MDGQLESVMKPKMMIKTGLDLVMTILLLVLLARQLTGDSVHEWLGAGMFLLWILHILNSGWHRRLGKGAYPPFRKLQTVVNLLLFLSMAGIMVSAVFLSREVFAFLSVSGGIALACSMHVMYSAASGAVCFLKITLLIFGKFF